MLFFVFALTVIVWCLIKIASKHYDYFEKRGIKFVKPYPLIGTNYWMLLKKAFAYDLQEKTKEFENEKIFGLYDFQTPVVVLNDPEIIKQITVKDFDHFTDRRLFLNPKMSNVVANLLIVMKGKKWHEMRTSLTPIFTSSKMRLMFELISNCGQQFAENLEVDNAKYGGSKMYEAKDICTKYTCDVIASCAFGYQSDSFQDPDNQFYNLGRSLLELRTPKMTMKLLMMRFSPAISRLLGFSMFDRQAAQNFYRLIVETIAAREQKENVRPDLINLLAQLKKGDLKPVDEDGNEGNKTGPIKRHWTDDELVAQCFVFFFAGFETVSTLLVFATYELAVNPDIQLRLREEIEEIQEQLGYGVPITYDAIQGMKYMDMVVNEALRKWPPGLIVDRLCTKNYQYDDKEGLKFNVEVGDLVWIPIYPIHHNPKYYPDPEKFDPERFNEENKQSFNSATFMPFGIGPRNCIGSRFALLEVKTLLFYLLSKFVFELSSETPVPAKLKPFIIGTAPEKPIMLKLKPLKL